MNEDYDKLVSQCRKDCAELSATALSDKYPTEYSSWRNGKNRAKDKWSQAFVEFREFLRVLGPKPGPEYTLDRIDFADPEYAPGKVRWADKATQSENR